MGLHLGGDVYSDDKEARRIRYASELVIGGLGVKETKMVPESGVGVWGKDLTISRNLLTVVGDLRKVY